MNSNFKLADVLATISKQRIDTGKLFNTRKLSAQNVSLMQSKVQGKSEISNFRRSMEDLELDKKDLANQTTWKRGKYDRAIYF